MDQAYRGDRSYRGRDTYDTNRQLGYPDSRGYSGERDPWRHPSKRYSYYPRDRSASPARKPAPVRQNTAQDSSYTPTPLSPAVMPSPITSPSEVGVESDQDKRMERATDPRRRAKLANGVQSPLATPKSPVVQTLSTSSLANISARVAQPQDVEMTDDSLGPGFTKPTQSLVKLSESITRAGAHFGVFQRQEEQYAEKRKAKEVAVEKFKDHPKYCDHAIRQESTAAAELKRASRLKTEFESDISVHAKHFMTQLSVTIEHSLKDSVVACDAIKTLQDQLELLKKAISKQKPTTSDNSDKIQSLRKSLEGRVNEVESASKSLKGSLTAQVKAELSEAHRQLQLKTTPLLSDCQTAKQECQKLQQGISDTMDDFKADKSKTDSQLQRLQDENATLRAQIVSLENQTSARDKEIADLKTSSVSRHDFENFKAEMLMKLQQVLVEAPKSASSESQDAEKLLEPYVSGYKQDLAKISNRIQSAADFTSTAKATAEFAHTRLDGFHRDFGSLRERLDKVEMQRPTETPPSPAPSPAFSPAALTTLRLEHETAVKRATASEKILESVQHAIRALNSRYNNLSSEALAQQIAGIINPINAQVISDVANLNVSMGQFSGHIRERQSAYARFSSRLDTVEAKLGRTPDLSEALSQLEARVEAIVDTAFDSAKFQDSFAKHQSETTMLINELKAANDLRKGDVDKIKQDLMEQDKHHKSTSLKIDEHLNDKLDTVKGNVEALQKKLPEVDTLAQSTKDNALKLATLQATVSTLQDHREKTKALEATADSGLRADFNSLKEGLSKEKGSIDERISSVATSLEELKELVDKEGSPDLLGRLSPLEDSVQSLKELVNKHTHRLEALGNDTLESFTKKNIEALNSNAISASTSAPDIPSQVSGSTGRDSGKDSGNDAKAAPRIPTGLRNTSTPKCDVFLQHLTGKSSAASGNKRRTRSPVSGSARKKAKQAKDRLEFEEKRQISGSIDLTTDDVTDDDDLNTGPGMMGKHGVGRRVVNR